MMNSIPSSGIGKFNYNRTDNISKSSSPYNPAPLSRRLGGGLGIAGTAPSSSLTPRRIPLSPIADNRSCSPSPYSAPPSPTTARYGVVVHNVSSDRYNDLKRKSEILVPDSDEELDVIPLPKIKKSKKHSSSFSSVVGNNAGLIIDVDKSTSSSLDDVSMIEEPPTSNHKIDLPESRPKPSTQLIVRAKLIEYEYEIGQTVLDRVFDTNTGQGCYSCSSLLLECKDVPCKACLKRGEKCIPKPIMEPRQLEFND